MIIGSILETSRDNVADEIINGVGMVIFYTAKDADIWARLQSAGFATLGANNRWLCCVIDTETNTRQFYYDGLPYS